MEIEMRYRFDGQTTDAVFVDAARLYPGAAAQEDAECCPGTAAQENKACSHSLNEAVPGYGFLTEENRDANLRLSIPELNSGFDTVYWYRGKRVTKLCADARGCFVDWTGEGQLPLTFVTDVPGEGNYCVKVLLYAQEPAAQTKVFLGRRQLVWSGTVGGIEQSGGFWEGTFVTNICPIIPRTYTEPMEDVTLDVTVLGTGVHLVEVSVEPWEGKTLYIAGDSTVTDQSADYPYLPGSSYCGWGQMLPCYLGRQLAVSNHAHSGLTTESFRSEGHYAVLRARIAVEDICLLQFGHNDQKLMHLKAEEGYRENLIRYIEEIRAKGAIPVLVTPLARNSWRGDNGSYNDLLAPYAAACKRLAGEYRVPLLDLHQKSMDFVKACGRERAMRYFYPADYTHSNDYGAYRFAGYVWEELQRTGLVGQRAQTVEAAVIPEDWEPPAILPQLTAPEDCADMKNPAIERLFEHLERPEEALTRVEALELVIAAMHFFPTNVYNDMFEDIIGHERYAGTVECAWQNGLIPETMICEGRFFPHKRISGSEFLQVLMNGYKSRRTWTKEQAKALEGMFVPEESIKRGVAAKMCKRSAI